MFRNSQWWMTLGVALALLLAVTTRQARSQDKARNSVNVRAKVIAEVRPQGQASALHGFIFADAGPGDAPQTISPQDSRALKCTVAGERHSVVHLEYPAAAVLRLRGASNSPDAEVVVEDIRPSLPGNGTLLPGDGSAAQLKWGGTRGRLRYTQHWGNYSGKLPVTVIYP